MTPTVPAHQRELFGHPVGLYVLFFTELWERFSYYGMRAILTLYMIAAATGENPGMGWAENEALALYGWYTMLVYVASIPGGIMADRWLGQKKAVLYGGLLLCIGHGTLAIESEVAFFTGLAFIIAGVGLLKPNISTMVGGLYQQGDARRDKGFTIFYIGINIGAFLASLIVGAVAAIYGWHYGFGLAGIGMLLGQLIYMLGQKYLTKVGNPPDKIERKNDASLMELYKKLPQHLVPLIVTGILLLASLYILTLKSIPYGLLALFLTAITVMLMMIYQELNKVQRDRFVVLLISFIIVIIFWGAFEQAGGLMNIYTEKYTNREVWGITIPAAVMQSWNPLFIIIFGVPVAAFWHKRKLQGKEASSLFKMMIGLIIMGSGFLWMRGAALQYQEIGQSALFWLILAYLFHTIGELCASPVALSFITKLAPVKYASLMMGVYFAVTGLGNKLAGIIGESATQFGELTIFTGIAVFCMTVGGLLLIMLKPLKRLTHNIEEDESDLSTNTSVLDTPPKE